MYKAFSKVDDCYFSFCLFPCHPEVISDSNMRTKTDAKFKNIEPHKNEIYIFG